MTTTGPIDMSIVQVAELLVAHLTHQQLLQPVSLTVTTRGHWPQLTAQVRSTTVADVAAQLLAWADTLSAVTVEAWRVTAGDRVHLSIASTLVGSAGAVELDVYGGTDHDPGRFTDLEPGTYRRLTLGHLRAWAASASNTTAADNAVQR